MTLPAVICVTEGVAPELFPEPRNRWTEAATKPVDEVNCCDVVGGRVTIRCARLTDLGQRDSPGGTRPARCDPAGGHTGGRSEGKFRDLPEGQAGRAGCVRSPRRRAARCRAIPERGPQCLGSGREQPGRPGPRHVRATGQGPRPLRHHAERGCGGGHRRRRRRPRPGPGRRWRRPRAV